MNVYFYLFWILLASNVFLFALAYIMAELWMQARSDHKAILSLYNEVTDKIYESYPQYRGATHADTQAVG